MTNQFRARVRMAATAATLAVLLSGCAVSPPGRSSDASAGSGPSSAPGAGAAPGSAYPFTPAETPTIMPAGAFAKPSKGGPTLAPTAGGPLDGKVIVVDPGHNGAFNPSYHNARVQTPIGNRRCMETGTESDTKPAFTEHEFNWQVSRRVVALLLSRGATVVLTRPDDSGVGPCNNERAEMANRAGADFMISIHADGEKMGRHGVADPQGFHVQLETKLVGGPALYDRSFAAAESVIRRMLEMTKEPLTNYVPRTPRGIWQRNGDLAALAGLTKTPAVLVELGNLKNPTDLARLKDAANQDAIAAALVAAMEDTLLKPEFQTPTSKPTTPSPSAATASATAGATP